MIKIKKFFKTSMLTMLIVSFFTLAVYGREPGSYPVAEPRFSPSDIVWVPLVNYSFLDLTIARPDGTLFSRTFESGSTPYADLSDILGKANLDGSYIYELRAMTESRQKRGEDDEVEIRYSTAPLVQTGGFSVLDRTIMNPEEQEPDKDKSKGISFSSSQPGLSGVQDFVINDDLIVIGSACIGFDCVNGESFGFDTIRLKENNLRIKFDDTSTIGSFPRNDWQLTANDSANGGASKFSIDDITNSKTPFTIEANARSNSLYVDDGGRLGIRTSTPALEIHVVDGDTPGLRLQQDGSSGFAPQTWDIAGNETNFFIRDVTGGSRLSFRIRPGAPTSSIDIASDGDIGMGTATPTDGFSLEIKRTSGNAGILVNNNDLVKFKLNVTTSLVQIGAQTNHKVNFVVNNAAQMTLDTTGFLGLGTSSPAHPIVVATANNARLEVSGNWVNPSSRELKENIESLTAEEAEETLAGLNPVKFNYKVDKTEGYVGFIAEDVPELVAVKDRKGLVTMDVVAVLTKVVQEQQKSLQEQQKINAQLMKKIAELEKK
jgi:hypothetical protein